MVESEPANPSCNILSTLLNVLIVIDLVSSVNFSQYSTIALRYLAYSREFDSAMNITASSYLLTTVLSTFSKWEMRLSKCLTSICSLASSLASSMALQSFQLGSQHRNVLIQSKATYLRYLPKLRSCSLAKCPSLKVKAP